LQPSAIFVSCNQGWQSSVKRSFKNHAANFHHAHKRTKIWCITPIRLVQREVEILKDYSNLDYLWKSANITFVSISRKKRWKAYAVLSMREISIWQQFYFVTSERFWKIMPNKSLLPLRKHISSNLTKILSQLIQHMLITITNFMQDFNMDSW